MRLVALYIKEHEYIFKESATINFGGRWEYSFNSTKNKVYVKREENKDFIYGFFDQTNLSTRIELISAIVGKNGTGKSSILDIVRSFFIRNGYALPYSKAVAICEIEGSEMPLVLHSDFESVEYRFNLQELEKSGNFEELTVELANLNRDDVQTLYYSPHFDYKYNLSFDEVDEYDISFDKLLENDLEDLKNKDTNSNGWNYSPSQELIFKNSIRQLMFLSSDLVRKNQIFKNLFDLPEHGEASLIFRGHSGKDPWNTPYTFRTALSIIKDKLEAENRDWIKIRVLDEKNNIANKIEVNKYLLKRKIIQDIISVLERQMEKNNSYLSEGKISIQDFEKSIINLDAFNSFLTFIENSQIKFRKSEWAAFDKYSIGKLLNSLFQYIDEIEDARHVQKDSIQIEPSKVVEILHLHRDFLLKLFNYYPKLKSTTSDEPLLEKSNKVEGFINYIPTTKKLSSGENALLNLFSRIYDFIRNNLTEESKVLPDKTHYILLLDEADLAFHPSWKRKFVKSLISTIPFFFNDLNGSPLIQIIFTTHDPLTLSDIPQSNVIYLDKKEEGTTFINRDKAESFGANVHDLLAHSFFLEDGFMGEYAQDLITDLIKYLTIENNGHSRDENKIPRQVWDVDKAQKVINIIDEPLIKERLQSLYNKKFLYTDRVLLEHKIQELQNQLSKLNDEENQDN